MIRRILFVCSGNTCRSSMAEGLFRQRLAESGLDWAADVVVMSAGVAARPGDRASTHAVKVAGALGADLSGHRARRVTVGDLRSADLVLTMTAAHKKALWALDPDSAEKVFTLAEFRAFAEKPAAARREYRRLVREAVHRVTAKPGGAFARLKQLMQRREELLKTLKEIETEKALTGDRLAGELQAALEPSRDLLGAAKDIVDPFGQDVGAYEMCATEINGHLEHIVAYLAGNAADEPFAAGKGD